MPSCAELRYGKYELNMLMRVLTSKASSDRVRHGLSCVPVSDSDVSESSDRLSTCQRRELGDLSVVKNDRAIAFNLGRDERELVHLRHDRRKHDWASVNEASVQDEVVVIWELTGHFIESNVVVTKSIGTQLVIELLVVLNIILLLIKR